MKDLYKLKLLREENNMIKDRKSEVMLRDLLTTLPTLKRHKIDAEVRNKVKTLRAGREQKNYTLELSRVSPLQEDLIVTTMGDVTVDLNGNLESAKMVAHRGYPNAKPPYGQKGTASMVVARKYIPQTLVASAAISRRVLEETDGKVKLLRKLKTDILTKVRDIRAKNKLPITEHKFREGVTVKKMAEVYIETNTFIKLQDKRIRNKMTSGKIPFNKENHIGVEIEFASKQDINKVCDALHEAGLGKYMHVKRDTSIAIDEIFPHQIELAIIAEQKHIGEVIQKTCDVLNNKLKVRIDKSCGIHVHLDMRNRKPERAFNNLILMQRYLYAMVPANRKLIRQGNGHGFSQPIQSPTWNVPDTHYWGVNTTTMSKYNTIEIRMHSGSSSARKINNFISFLLSIIESDIISETPETMASVQATFKLSDSLRKYIESRIAKFAPQHKKLPNPSWMGAVEKVSEAADEVETEGSEVA